MLDALIKVEVTDKKAVRIFDLHEGLLCHYSSYFESAINGGFAEGEAHIVRIQEKMEVFLAFRLWLYTGKLVDDFDALLNQTRVGFRLFSRLWVFGDMRGVPWLQNAAIDGIHDLVERTWVLPQSCIAYTYENSLEGGLRRFLLHMVAYLFEDLEDFVSIVEKHGTKIPQDFFHGLLRIRGKPDDDFQRASKDDFAEMNTCLYHNHERPTSTEGRRQQVVDVSSKSELFGHTLITAKPQPDDF